MPITKDHVLDYYAKNRTDNNRGICSTFVVSVVSKLSEDNTGIYSPASELMGGARHYYTMTEVKHIIRCELSEYIKDLQKIMEI